MRRVLITGASGFIGRAVVRRLAMEPDLSVYAVVSGRREVCLGNSITIVKADLLCPEQVIKLISRIKPDVCVHLAWELPGNDAFQHSPSNLNWLQASLLLLQQFAEVGGNRFIFAGSSSEYGAFGMKPCSSSGGKASSLYGICKRAFTETAQVFSEDQRIEFACARYFSIYGEYDVRPARAIPYAIQRILGGEKIVCKSPNSVWDYLYVEDAANATVKVVQSTLTGPINIASGIPRSMSEVFQTIANLCGRPELVECCNEGKSGEILVANTDRLRHEVGFQPSFCFEEGLRRTICWWKGRAAVPELAFPSGTQTGDI